MKAFATADFTASANGVDYAVKAGEQVEADSRVIGAWKEAGLVTTAKPKADKKGKAVDNG